MSVQFSALTQCTMGEFGSSSLEVGVRANSAPPLVYPIPPVLAVLLPRHGKCSSGVTLGCAGAPAITKARPLVGISSVFSHGSGMGVGRGQGKVVPRWVSFQED